MSFPVKHVSVDGRRLAYRDAGSGPAMMFLHGLGGNSASWEPQFARFAATHRVVAWDMPGFGESESLATPSTTTRTLSTLAARLMDALGIERSVGIGTSYGTLILADLAQSNPGRIAGMVFACGVIGMAHLPADKRAHLRATRRAELAAMGQRKFAETRNSTYLGKGVSQAMIDRVIALAGSASAEGYMQAYGAMTESNIFPSLAGLDVPALVISGADDPIAPAADCERVADALSNAEYHRVENTGHYVNLEQAETFNRLIEDFLTRTTPPPKAPASVR